MKLAHMLFVASLFSSFAAEAEILCLNPKAKKADSWEANWMVLNRKDCAHDTLKIQGMTGKNYQVKNETAENCQYQWTKADGKISVLNCTKNLSQREMREKIEVFGWDNIRNNSSLKKHVKTEYVKIDSGDPVEGGIESENDSSSVK